ncbi:MAG: hypothetical protein PHW47_09910 [Lachnospira sp.]|nr:hypothetical protein [Lachnospira sp.]
MIPIQVLSKTGYAFIPASKTAAIHKAPVTHAITVTVGEGGTISPRGTILVNHGDSKTFTISPNKNYLIESVTIDGINQGKITTYTFTDIVENHSISATFKYNDNATTEEGSKPAPTEPMPTEPAPTKPAPTEPTLTEPTPT